jgi:hypothetical protein
MKVLRSFETSGIYKPATQRKTPEELNRQHNAVETTNFGAMINVCLFWETYETHNTRFL